MKKLTYFLIIFIVSCGDNTSAIKVDEKTLAMDVDRLCAIVSSSPKFQARGEYIKGYYQILDKYGLSQDSETIQDTFDGMTELLATGSFCEVRTIHSIKEAINPKNPNDSAHTKEIKLNIKVEETEEQASNRISDERINQILEEAKRKREADKKEYEKNKQ